MANGAPVAVGFTATPVPLFVTVVLDTRTRGVPELGATLIPVVNPMTTDRSTVTVLALRIWTPFGLAGLAPATPSRIKPRRRTASVAPALTMMPFVPLTRTPARSPSAMMLMALVMVTAPYPPGSSTLISPFAAVLEMAPAKVLHGAVREQGLASSPTPETQVRVA